jgi:hypothetical protein
MSELNSVITKWVKAQNEHPKPLIWTKSADETLAAVER